MLLAFSWQCLSSQSLTIQDDGRIDLNFDYDNLGPDPHLAELMLQFSHAEISIDIRAFWTGHMNYTARFQAPRAGEWQYTIYQEERGLIANGSFFNDVLNDTDPFQKYGRLKVAESGRHLSHEDGTPFFYLADTAWEISWKSERDQVIRYLDDRQAKGFTAIQFVPLSHQLLFSHGITNRENETFFLNEDFTILSHRYFEYIDFLVDEINKRGMLAVLVPMWAYMTELYPETGPQHIKIPVAEALGIARYIGARYAGDNILWIVGGDNVYDTLERKNFWTEFAEELDRASGRQHLITLHPHGFGASFDYFDNHTKWLDFHSFQSSHLAEADYPWEAASRGFRFAPAKPILNIEATYEDIFHNLWAPGDTDDAESFRIRPEHVRLASYESILTGALVGITYGANGVWQWNTEQFPGSHQPRLPVDQAWHFPGSSHMTILKDIMIQHDWYSFTPAFGVVKSSSPCDFVPTAFNDDFILSYLPTKVESVDYDFSNIAKTIRYRWISPLTGDSSTETNLDLSTTGGELRIEKPSQGDWVWSASIVEPADPWHPQAPFLAKGVLAPNPFSQESRFKLRLPEAGLVEYKIWDLQGKLVDESKREFAAGEQDFEFRLSAKGVLLFHIIYTKGNEKLIYRGKLLSM